MNPVIMTHTDTLFPDLFEKEDVARWRDEHRRLMSVRAKINTRIQALEQMIAGATMYSKTEDPEVSTEPVKAEATTPETTEALPNVENTLPLTMNDAILQVIKLNPRGLEPKQIASIIRGNSHLSAKIRESHPNYLYTALARLVVKGQIRKSGSAYKIPKQTAGTVPAV